MEAKGKLVFALLLISLSRCQTETIANIPSSLSLLHQQMEDSGSIEMPVRKPRMEPSQHRPIIEFVLGVLDTFQSSSKSELKRIKARQARQTYQILTTDPTTTEGTVPKLLSSKLTTPKKRFSIGKL